jgi:ubiquinone/menaquinone biosynthesis C-methylase UbiE
MAGVPHEVFITPAQSKAGIEGIVEASNLLIERALVGKFDYLWLVQGDVEVPVNAFRSLFSLDVDVAQGVVRRHDGDGLICGFMDEKAKVWYLPRGAIEGQVLSGWVFAGLSCTLIRRRVLEAGIRFRYERGVGEDILFMFEVQKAGFVAKVHGDVLCGHLPEFPLATYTPGQARRHAYDVLDVGCGHRHKGDVNVDLFMEATAHRAADQRVNDDVALDIRSIPNFVRADACHLPFRDRAFGKVYSWHLIEHLEKPEVFLAECCHVADKLVEVRCPNGDPNWKYGLDAYGETKPLHLHRLTREWFEERLKAFPDWDWAVHFDYSQSEPYEIVVEGYRKDMYD